MAEQFFSQSQQQRQLMVLAPQLRQSLELLQVPVMELLTLVQQEMEQNPTIEEQPTDAQTADAEKDASGDSEAEKEFKDEFDKLAKLDDEWREYFHQNQTTQRYSSDEAAKRQYFLDSLSQPESLQQHLMDQLSLAALGDTERQIGELLIGSINEDGYLTSTIEDLASSTGHTVDHLNEVLDLIREFDPIGVGAKDLRECLLIQLRRVGKEDSLVATIVRDHLDALGARKYPEIARILKISVEEVQEIARFIATLEPKPGRLFVSDAPAYVLPEVVVQKIDGEYVVLLNNDHIPHLHISDHYRQLMSNTQTTSEVKSYIREKIRAGMFLIKSIGQRQQTIFNIATEIVKVQKEFLDHGVTHLRPLTMAEVAAVVGIHETTVSRAIANKYMQTPRGTFDMKYFFTPGYKTTSGATVSNKTIKDALAQLVANEDHANPLSDQAMVEALQQSGTKIARRTIAKYREELKILPSHLRRSF
ncbi:MAG: RNA polymerase factor sigma-54 [bacterium]